MSNYSGSKDCCSSTISVVYAHYAHVHTRWMNQSSWAFPIVVMWYADMYFACNPMYKADCGSLQQKVKSHLETI